ncbi:MAG: hypothetical protein ACTSVI_06355 [Promethearchaeota archaeon]
MQGNSSRRYFTLLFLSCILLPITGIASTHVALAVKPNTSRTLDLSGAIDIKDPFGACHADSYDVMEELGVKINRKDITWAGIEPQDDQWNWNSWDNRISSLLAKNMSVLPILDYSNHQVQDNDTSYNTIYSEHDINEWIEYVNECVERYYVNNSMHVKYWEIWNEPNLGGENDQTGGFWTGSDEQFFELQKRTAANLSATYPDLQILSGGISGHNPSYLDKMFAYGAMENIDILAFHPYSGSNYDTLDVKINEVKEVCKKYNFTGKLWITEVGMATAFNPDEDNFEEKYQDSLELQASLVPKVYAKSLANGVETVVWYCLGDFNNWTWGEANFGLVYASGNIYKPGPYENDTLKPAGFAYKALAHNLNWSKYVPKGIIKNDLLPSSSKLESYYFLKQNGDIVLILWNGNNINQNVQFNVPNATGITTYSGPSYKLGDAENVNYTIKNNVMDVSVSINFVPTILIINRTAGANPVNIILETRINFFDITILFITPSLVAASIAIIVIFYIKNKRMR